MCGGDDKRRDTREKEREKQCCAECDDNDDDDDDDGNGCTDIGGNKRKVLYIQPDITKYKQDVTDMNRIAKFLVLE